MITQEEFFTACQNNDIEVARQYIAEGGNVSIRNGKDIKGLWYAAHAGFLEMTKLLIAAGADVNDIDLFSWVTLLASVCLTGNIEIVRALIKAGADVNAVDRTKQTVLMDIARRLNTAGVTHDCINELAAAGADIETRDIFGNTPLIGAAQSDNVEAINSLIAIGAYINACNELGDTALTEAASRGHTDCVRALIAAGADVNILVDGNNALMEAALYGHTDCVKVLLEAGIDVNARGSNNQTALMQAASKGHVECVCCLIDAGANIKARTASTDNAMTLAAKGNYVECIKVLASAGIDPNTFANMSEWKHKTALACALKASNYDAAIALVQVGADIYIKGKNGRPVLDLCHNKDVRDRMIFEYTIRRQIMHGAIQSVNSSSVITKFDIEH